MRVIICGDIALYGQVATMIAQGVRDRLKAANVFIANVECPLTDSDRPYWTYFPTLKGPTKAAVILQELGVTVGSLANNHIADYGLTGLTDTIEALEDNGIAWVGAGRNPEEAIRPLVLKSGDMAVGIVALAQPEISAARNGRWGAGVLTADTAIGQVRKLRKEVDLVISYLHMGVEWFSYPTPQQVRLCRALIDAGARLVIGHHPHVVQGFEYYKDGFIAYSLGNFIFDMKPGAQRFSRLGLIVQADINRDGIEKIELLPIDTRDGEPRLLEGSDRLEAEEYLKGLSSVLNDREELLKHYYFTCRDNLKIHLRAFIYYGLKKWNYRRIFDLLASQRWPQIRQLRCDLLRFLLSGKAMAIEESIEKPSQISFGKASWHLLCRIMRMIGFGWGHILDVT